MGPLISDFIQAMMNKPIALVVIYALPMGFVAGMFYLAMAFFVAPLNMAVVHISDGIDNLGNKMDRCALTQEFNPRKETMKWQTQLTASPQSQQTPNGNE